MIYNNGTREAYRNSTLVASGTGGLPLATDFNAFYVGNNTLTDTGMDAKLDNFTIWTGALTPAEVAALSVRPTVPEPATGVLAVVGVIAASMRRSRGKEQHSSH